MKTEKHLNMGGIPVQTCVKAGKFCFAQDIRDACKQGWNNRMKQGMDETQNNNEYLACVWSC
jgi:hypothetical protein